MKYINKICFALLFLITVMQSCKKDENLNYFEGGTPPVLTATLANNTTFILKPEDSTKILLTFSWTNPNYKFTTGISSQSVIYTIEIDSAGNNFKGTNLKSITPDPTFSLSKTLTVAQMNDYLLNGLKFDSAGLKKADFRIKSNLINGNAVLYSNTMSFLAKVYPIPPKVTPPSSNELFITGAASPKGWMNGGDAPVASQKFTKISETKYELASINLNASSEYLIVPRYGNWSAVGSDPEKYGAIKSPGNVNPDGDDFQRFGNNYKSPAIGGNYKITMDFQAGTFKLTKI